MTKCVHCGTELGLTRWTILPRAIGLKNVPQKHPWLHRHPDNDYPIYGNEKPERGMRQPLGPYCRECARALATGRGMVDGHRF